LIVTHDPEVAEYAHRVVRMRDGHVMSDTRNATPLRAADVLARMTAQAAE
jgi:putative ABC transport system ATP-binding protein